MKKVLISVMALITVILMSTNVMAATSGAVTLTASTGIVKAKDEFTITVKATDSNNLNTVEYSSITVTDGTGKETNAISLKSVDIIGEWSNMNYDGKTAFVYSGSAKQEENVCKLTFTVSDNIVAGTYNINVNGLTVYSTNLLDDTTTIGTKTATVVVEKEVVEDNKNNTVNNENKVPSNNTNKNNTTKLPQTGIEDTGLYAVIILSIVSIVAYTSYRRYRDI